MNFLTANTTSHRRAIMFIAAALFGAFTAVVFYQFSLAVQEFIFPGLIGLLIFEILFRMRNRLSLMTLPLFILALILPIHLIYGLLFSAFYGGTWSPISSLQYLFTEFPYVLYFIVEISIVTGFAYYLIKMYRIESWEVPGLISAENAGNEPIFEGEGLVENNWLQRYSQQIVGFVGWYLIATVLATPDTFGLITTPVTLIALIAFSLSKKLKGVAGGMLLAVALNFVLSLARGASINAWCFVPFYTYGF